MQRTLPKLLPLLALAATPLAARAQMADPWAVLARPRTHAPRPTTPAITPADLMTRLYIFADDSMQGRLIATPGNSKGVEYIAGELRRMGLEPAGDNGTFFQDIHLVERGIDESAAFGVNGTALRAWTDYVPRDNGPGARSVDGAQAVWGGTMTDSAHMIDSAAVAGKLVVIGMGPGYAGDPPGTANRIQLTRRYRRAAGIAFVGMDALTPASLALYRQPLQLMQGAPGPELPSYMYVTKRAAALLMGADPETLQPGAAGATVTGSPRFAERPTAAPARNVVAILRGSDPALRSEYVAIGAHNDHIGTSGEATASDSMYIVNHLFRAQGADDDDPHLTEAQQAQVNAALAQVRRRTGGASARVDSIYNGADDDGSGSMGVLEIAQWFASRPRPKRSLLFVWHVGEEEGLFGSEYYTDHPTVPRESIVAQLNMDMIGRGGANDVTGTSKDGAMLHGGPGYVQLVGSRRLSTELGDLAETVNRTGNHGLNFDYAMDANGHPQNIYCRSDHYEYARYGIPIIFFTTGGHADYHQVTDEPQYIDYGRMAQVANFVADLATHVANLDHRPVVDHPKPDPHGNCVQ
ncbi:M28 family peptidase [Longimicrobium sp.]|uniref:M28 family peptidase n=1 Tax=Longimicrobium sp. TaxID=2029185 RepID=UPI002B9352F4|nr:M28 family peptidase [Longimicrobium sp.]HSU17846.1 M28 family peptidase [Longimicrobium sp.]